MARRGTLAWWCLVGAMALLIASCRGAFQKAPGNVTPTSEIMGESRPANVDTAPPAAETPTTAPLLGQATADLDNDGLPEEIGASEQDQHLRVTISSEHTDATPWHLDLANGVRFDAFQTEDLNADGLVELLVETDGPAADQLGLVVIQWQEGEGRILASQAGQPENLGLQSRCYRPWTTDLDGDGIYEIVLAAPGSDERYLDSIVYAWDGDSFRQTELYLLPPRPAPTAVPS